MKRLRFWKKKVTEENIEELCEPRFRRICKERKIPFIPFVFTMIKYTDNRVSLAGSHSAVALGSSFQLASVKVDATNITYTFTNNTGGNYTPTLRYYICEIPL